LNVEQQIKKDDTHGRRKNGLHWMKVAIVIDSAKVTAARMKSSLRQSSLPRITRLLILAMRCVIVLKTGKLTESDRKMTLGDDAPSIDSRALYLSQWWALEFH